MAPGWPGGGLDRFYYPGTIQDLAGWVGVAGLAGPDGREFWYSVKKLMI